MIAFAVSNPIKPGTAFTTSAHPRQHEQIAALLPFPRGLLAFVLQSPKDDQSDEQHKKAYDGQAPADVEKVL